MNDADMMKALENGGFIAVDPGTPAQQLEQRVDYIIRELDEICKMAVNPETSDLIAGRKFELKEIVRRSMRAILLIEARKAAPFRRHSNVA